MNKVKWIVFSMIGIFLVSGCSHSRTIRRLNKDYKITVTEVKHHIPEWLKTPLTEKADKIEAIGVASSSIIPEVARSRAQNDLYNNLARSISTYVAVRVKDMIEEHPVYQDLELSYSQVLYQKISDQVSKRELNNIMISDIWIDRYGIFGTKDLTYAYGWINRQRAEADGLKALAAKLRKDKIRMKLSKQAEEKLNNLIEDMYKKAAELEKEASEHLNNILDTETQKK